ncbi:hypothetical protein MASR2M64_12730 [Candidatus Cloacimonadota bacterium]
MKKFLVMFLLLALASFALADTYTIGTGTSTQNYVPFYGLYDFSWSKTIYTAAEINTAGLTAAGNLVGIGYEVGNTPANYTMMDQRVYIRTTTQSVYETADNLLPDNTQFTQVYMGNITYNGGGWHYVMFSAPFAWDGTSNIEIVWENWDGDYVSGYPNFRYTTTTPDYRSVYKYADTTFPAALTGTRYYNRPNIQFVTPQLTPPNPAVAIYPTVNGYAFTDAMLSWQSGGGMPSSYNVYLGTTNPPTTMVSEGQAGSSYTPAAALQLGTTYYWQVIPVNSNGPAAECPVWSFKTPGAEQLAESFNETAWPPAGWANPGTFTRSTTLPFHGAATAYKSATTTPTLLSTPMLSITGTSELNFWLRTSATTGNGRLQIQYSTDRVEWSNLGAIIEVPADVNWHNHVVDLSSLAGNNYYLAFTASSATSSTALYIDHVFGPNITPLTPGPVTLALPADAAINQSAYPTLTWTAGTIGGVASSYKVYLDTNPDPTTLVGTVTGMSYTFATALAYNTTYYWKVIASNSAGDAEASAVRSFTTMDNPIISTFPWTVDFGTAAADWPVLNWTQLSGFYPTPAGTSVQWLQDDWLNVTTPANKAAKINIYGTTRYGWLVTPPIAIPADGYELKFDAALMTWNASTPPTTTQDDDKFIVVMSDTPTMTNPVILREWNNTGSPYVLNSIPNTGENYSIVLTGITGTKYFAFYGESTVTGNGDNDFMIDNVTIRQIPSSPIFVITPESYDFGEVNQAETSSKSFTISNTGSGTLGITAITISGSPTFVLGGLPTLPASIATGESVTFMVTFTPGAVGNMSATVSITDNLARVIHTVPLTGSGVSDITVGDGSQNANWPMNFYYKSSLFETMYYPAELSNFNGMITGIKLYTNFLSNIVDTPTHIWMGTTTQEDLSAAWIPSTELTQVFSGTMNYPSGENIIFITFTQPFAYTNGQNLVMMFHRPLDNSYYNSSDYFKSQTIGTTRTRRLNSDTAVYDPAAPATTTATGQFPKTTFVVSPIVDLPEFAITPTSHAYNTVTVGQTAAQVFTVSNAGTGTLSINSVALSGSPMMSITSTLPTFPVALTAGQQMTFTVTYAPTAIGTHAATITIIDNLNARVPHTVALTGTGGAILYPPTNLAASVAGTSVALSWDAPYSPPPPAIHLNDNFEAYPNFSLNMGNWELVDVDQSTTYGFTGITFPNSGAAMAYIVLNPTATTPAVTGLTAHSGNKMAASFAATTPGNNDWMMSPVSIVEQGYSLRFWARSYTADYGLERFKVGVSTGGITPADFTIISGATYVSAPVDWTEYSYDLSAYVGQDVRVGIQCVSNDAFIFLVDDVSIGTLPIGLSAPAIAAVKAPTVPRTIVTAEPVVAERTSSRAILGYKVYRNGNLVNTINSPYTLEYIDAELELGTYSYTVTANYDEGESIAAGPVTAEVVPIFNMPTDLTASVDGTTVTLDWGTPGTWLSWTTEDALGNSIGTNAAATFMVAQRWDQGDLSGYQGGALTKFQFVPSFQDCIYTAKVWAGGSATAPGTLVYSQAVSNFTIGMWNEVLLPTPINLPTTGDLWVGYEVNTQGGYPAGCDNGPQVQGKGNMMYFNNAWTTLTGVSAGLTYNWSIRAYVSEGGVSKAIAYKPIKENNVVSYITEPFSVSHTATPRTDTRALTGYKVYRDGILQATYPTSTRTHIDIDVPSGTHEYGVTATFTNGESNPATISVTIFNIISAMVFEDGFEEYPNFATSINHWTLRDIDNAPTYGINGVDFPGSGGNMAYIIFNPSATVPPITTLNAHNGSKMAAAFAAQNALNNDWLISRRVSLGTDSALKFFARSHTAEYGLERFRVGVSTLASSLPGGFQYVSGPDYVEAPAAWTEFAYDLSAYDNQEVWIAIRCVSDNAFVFYVDDFAVYSDGGVPNTDLTVPVVATALLGNYPNPFNPETTISFSMKETAFVSLEIYNVKGQLVKTMLNGVQGAGNHKVTWNGMDNNGRAVSSGVYYYKMNTGKYSSTKKMIMMK